MSKYTAEADAIAQDLGILVPFTYDPNTTGGVVNYVDGGSIGPAGNVEIDGAVVVGSTGGVISVLDATGSAAKEVNYLQGPHELTAHEVGGHVRDALNGTRAAMRGDHSDFLPFKEVGALTAENQVRAAAGISVYRKNYNGPVKTLVTPGGSMPAPPNTILDYIFK